MEVIAIANQKGGCGKTTTAINLSAELGAAGKRTLLIDMDPQGHATLGLGIAGQDISGLYEVFTDQVNLFGTILSDVVTGVDLIPATISLAAIEPLLSSKAGRERQLLDQLKALKALYEYVIIDCPPSLGLLSINALRAATQVLAPMESSRYALDGIEQLHSIVNLLVEKYEIELPIKVLPTMFDNHTRFAHTILAQIKEQLPVATSHTKIRHTVRVREAAYLGKPLREYAPRSTAAADYKALAEEFIVATQAVIELSKHEPTSAPELQNNATIIQSTEVERRMVVLDFDEIECSRLQLAGDFNGWIPDQNIETQHTGDHWQKTFTAEPGMYEYRLIIDGIWQQDPTNPAEIPSEHGTVNSLLQVPRQAL